MPRTDGKPIAKTAAKTGQDPLVEQLVDSGTPREKAERMSAEMQRNGRYRVVSAKERARAVSAKERGDEKIAEGKLQEEPVQTVDLLSEEEAVNDVAPEAVASAKSVEVAGSRTPPQKAKPTPRAAGTPKPRTPPQKAKPTCPPAKPRTPPQKAKPTCPPAKPQTPPPKAKPTPRAAGTAGPLPGRPKRMMFTAAGELQEAASDMHRTFTMLQTYARTNKSVSRKVGLYVADAACRLLIRMSWRNPIDPTTRCESMALKASDFYMKEVAKFVASGFLKREKAHGRRRAGVHGRIHGRSGKMIHGSQPQRLRKQRALLMSDQGASRLLRSQVLLPARRWQ